MLINKESNFVSAIIYVHNNEKSISSFIKAIHEKLSVHFGKYEIICVNDASIDNSINVVKKLAEGLDGAVISVVNMSYYQGTELSMNAGVDLAIGDFVFEFDSTIMDYDINTIMETYHHTLKGFDIVSAASRNTGRTSSKFFYKVFNKFSNNTYDLKTESFRILSRRAINRIHAMSKTIPYRKAVYANSGLKLDTIFYEGRNDVRESLEQHEEHMRQNVAIDSLVLFTDVAYKISIGMSMLMIILTVIMAVYTGVIFFGGSHPVEGWTTTMLFLSLAFFGTFAILTIIIKYLSLLIDLVFKRQKYTIISIEKINN
jgi:glycosyltransferase involved in cell wall biosynthesis